MKTMNGGKGGVLRGDCVLSVTSGRKKRRGKHGAQRKGNGRRHGRAELKGEQGLDGEWC